MKTCTLHINRFSMLLRQLSSEGTGGTHKLFTNAKGSKFSFFNDFFALGANPDRIRAISSYITQLSVVHRKKERIIGINKRPTIVVMQTGTTIAGINWASVNRFINSCSLSVISGLPSCTPLLECINAIVIPSLLPFFSSSICPVCCNSFSVAA